MLESSKSNKMSTSGPLSLTNWDTSNMEFSDLGLSTDTMLDLQKLSQPVVQKTSLPLKKRSYADMNSKEHQKNLYAELDRFNIANQFQEQLKNVGSLSFLSSLDPFTQPLHTVGHQSNGKRRSATGEASTTKKRKATVLIQQKLQKRNQ